MNKLTGGRRAEILAACIPVIFLAVLLLFTGCGTYAGVAGAKGTEAPSATVLEPSAENGQEPSASELPATYEKAAALAGEKRYPQAMGILMKLPDDPRAQELLNQLRYIVNGSGIRCGAWSAAALAPDGRLKISDYVAIEEKTPRAVAAEGMAWKNIASLSETSSYSLAALTQEGDIALASIYTAKDLLAADAPPTVDMGHVALAVASWENIAQLDCTYPQTAVALTRSGDVFAAYPMGEGYIGRLDWQDVVTVADGRSYALGLKSDGTVLCNNYGRTTPVDVSGWRDIVAIDAGWSAVGLKRDGTVLSCDSEFVKMDVSGWTDIIAISTDEWCTLGLKRDGTVVAAGDNRYGQLDVGDWKDIVAIDTSAYLSIGLKADGTLMIAGQCANYSTPAAPDVSGMTGLYVPQLSFKAAEAATSKKTPAEEGFAGDWAGVWFRDSAEALQTLNFADALSNSACLMRVSKTDAGHVAEFGGGTWELTAIDEKGFTMVCTGTGGRYAHADSIFYFPYIEKGDTVTFTYTERVENAVPDMSVPEEHILRGVWTTSYGDQTMGLLMAYLPPSAQRSDKEGKYPCWYGGYENMEGDLKGMFLLGMRDNGMRFIGAVMGSGESGEAVASFSDDSDLYMPRDMLFGDVLTARRVYDVPDAWWPSFGRYSLGKRGFEAKDATAEHTHYVDYEYLPRLKAEIEALKAHGQDIWTQRAVLVRQGLLDYGVRMARGKLPEKLIPLVTDMISTLPEYLPEVSLAGIKPGDTLTDAKKLYDLTELPPEQAKLRYWGAWVEERYGIKHYWDGKGLTIEVLGDGRVSYVWVNAAGYETPGSRQVGDELEPGKELINGKYGMVFFAADSSESERRAITEITLNVLCDRVWDHTELDFDGDGRLEYLTLSGESFRNRLGCGTQLGDSETGTVDPDDYGTRAVLTVYKDGAVIARTELPVYLYYLFPSFCDKLQKDVPNKVWIYSETGGTGLAEPCYEIVKGKKGFTTRFLGFIDIYS